MYVKRGDVVACLYILYRVVPEERPSVRVLVSAVDDSVTLKLCMCWY